MLMDRTSEYINVDDLCEELGTTRNKLALVSLGNDVKEYIKTESLSGSYEEIKEDVDWHCNPIVINDCLYKDKELSFFNRMDLVQNGSIYYKTSEIKNLLCVIETVSEEKNNEFKDYLDSLFRPHIYMFYDEIKDFEISINDFQNKISDFLEKKIEEGVLIAGKQALKDLYGGGETNLYDTYSHWKDEFLQDENDVKLYWKQKLCTKMNLTNPSQKIELKDVNSLQIMPYIVKNDSLSGANRWENGNIEPNYFDADIKKIQKYFPHVQDKLDFDKILDNLTIEYKEKVLKLYPNSEIYIDRLIRLNKIISIRQNLVNKIVKLVKETYKDFNKILNFKNMDNLFYWVDDWYGDPDGEFGGGRRLYNYFNPIFSNILNDGFLNAFSNTLSKNNDFLTNYSKFCNYVTSEFKLLGLYNEHKLNLYYEFFPINYYFPLERMVYYCLKKQNNLDVLESFIVYFLANSFIHVFDGIEQKFNLFEIIFVSLLKFEKIKQDSQNRAFINFIRDIKLKSPDIENVFEKHFIDDINKFKYVKIDFEKVENILNIIKEEDLSYEKIISQINDPPYKYILDINSKLKSSSFNVNPYIIEDTNKFKAFMISSFENFIGECKYSLIIIKTDLSFDEINSELIKNFHTSKTNLFEGPSISGLLNIITNIESCYEFIIQNSRQIIDLINKFKSDDLKTEITNDLQNSKEYEEYAKEIFGKYNNFSPADLPMDMFSCSPMYPIDVDELLDPKDLFITTARINKIPFHKNSSKNHLLRKADINNLKNKIYHHIQYDNYYNKSFLMNNLFYSPEYKIYLMGSMFETNDEELFHAEKNIPELKIFQQFLDNYKNMVTKWREYFYNLQFYTFLCETKNLIDEELKKRNQNTLLFGIEFEIPLGRIGYDTETDLNDYFTKIKFDNEQYDAKSNAFDSNSHYLPDFINSFFNIDKDSLYCYFGGVRSSELANIFSEFLEEKEANEGDVTYSFLNLKVNFDNYCILKSKINEYMQKTFKSFREWREYMTDFDNELSKFFDDFYGDKKANLPKVIDDYLQLNLLFDFSRWSREEERNRRGEGSKTNLNNEQGDKIGFMPYKPKPSEIYKKTLERLFGIEGTFLFAYVYKLAIKKSIEHENSRITIDLDSLAKEYKEKYLDQIYSETSSSCMKSSKKIKNDIFSMLDILSEIKVNRDYVNFQENKITELSLPLIHLEGKEYWRKEDGSKGDLTGVIISIPDYVIPKIRGNSINTNAIALIPETIPQKTKYDEDLTPNEKKDLMKLSTFLSSELLKKLQDRKELKTIKNECELKKSGKIIYETSFIKEKWQDVLIKSKIREVIKRPKDDKEYLKKLINVLLKEDKILSQYTDTEFKNDIKFIAHEDFCKLYYPKTNFDDISYNKNIRN